MNDWLSNPELALDLETIQEELTRRARRKIDSYFPDSGPLRRELYAKHLEFFRAGAEHRERAFVAGNRCGKTIAGAYEMTLHLTGEYPDWWEGRRFRTPVDAWAAGDTNLTTRDIIQRELLGPIGQFGTGMIPGDAIERTTTKAGVSGAVDTIFVRHATGGTSALGLKSYAEGRANFQGVSKHVAWVDEEPPMDVYLELLMRTMVVPNDPQGGLVMLSFTPLSGWSEVVQSFLGE